MKRTLFSIVCLAIAGCSAQDRADFKAAPPVYSGYEAASARWDAEMLKRKHQLDQITLPPIDFAEPFKRQAAWDKTKHEHGWDKLPSAPSAAQILESKLDAIDSDLQRLNDTMTP